MILNRKLGALALTTLALTLAACDKKSSDTTTTTEGTTTGSTEGTGTTEGTATEGTTGSGSGGGTLVIQSSADVPTLDPGTTYDTASGEIVENIYETLVTYKGNSLRELEPVLATEWEEGDEGKTYRFTLREGVKFHSGNAMTCADAEYSFRRNLVTNTANSGNWFIAESLLGTGSNAKDDTSITWEKISSAVKCDGETLVFTLPKADPAFLSKLAYVGQSVVDSAHAKEVGEWDGTEATWKDVVGVDLAGSPLNEQPSGTGAYRLVKRDANSVALTAFSDYWGGEPNIKNVLLQKVTEPATRIQAFLKGDADFIETGGRPIIEDQLRGKPGVAILDDLPDTTATALSMNQNIKGDAIGSGKLDGKGIPANFFSDVNVRKGFIAAFDVPLFIKEVQLDKGKPRNFLLPDSFPGYDASLEPSQFNLDTAKSEFQKAWGGQVWENGFTLNVTYRAGSRGMQTAMEMLKKNVESLNPKFKLNVVAKPWSDIIANADKGGEPMISTSWAPDYADPDNFVHTFYSSEGYYNGRLNAKDEQIDAWINEARSTTDTARRDELYAQIARRAQDLAWYVVFPSAVGATVYRDNIGGVSAETYNPMSSFSFAGTFWKNLSKS